VSQELRVIVPADFLREFAVLVAGILAERDVSTAPSPYLSVSEAAEYLRWPPKRLYNFTASQAIPHFKRGNRILFRRDELDGWLERHREGPAA